jgi:hypothetical protein
MWVESKGRIEVLERENGRLQGKLERAEGAMQEIARALYRVQGRGASAELYGQVLERVREIGKAWQAERVVPPEPEGLGEVADGEDGWVEQGRLPGSRTAKAYHRQNGIGGL